MNHLLLFSSFLLSVPLNTLGIFRSRSALLVADPFHCGSIAERTGPLLPSETSAQTVGPFDLPLRLQNRFQLDDKCRLSNAWWWATGKRRCGGASRGCGAGWMVGAAVQEKGLGLTDGSTPWLPAPRSPVAGFVFALGLFASCAAARCGAAGCGGSSTPRRPPEAGSSADAR